MIEQGKSVFLSETDGRQVVVVSPATQGWNTFFTGAGDLIVDGIIQRGNGTKIHLEWDDVESRGLKIIEFSFAEPVEIHDGQAFYTPTSNWKTSDIINFYIKIPANNPITNLNNERCSSCGVELLLSKMYIDGQVLCPVCITKSLYKLQMSKSNHKCPNCGYEL